MRPQDSVVFTEDHQIPAGPVKSKKRRFFYRRGFSVSFSYSHAVEHDAGVFSQGEAH